MITFKEYFMLQEAPVGAAQKARADRTSKEMMDPSRAQGRVAGGAGGEQPSADIPAGSPLPKLQNHLDMTHGAQDPARPAAAEPATPAAPEPAPGAFGTPFDGEIAALDVTNPDAVQELLGRMNQAIVSNQGNLDQQNAAAEKGLAAPNQDRLGVAGANLGKQRNYLQSQQM